MKYRKEATLENNRYISIFSGNSIREDYKKILTSSVKAVQY
jgi:hypothetical protein